MNYDIEAKLVSQNSEEFLVGIFTITQVLNFTRYTERLIVGYDEENIPIYNNQIQRKISPTKVNQIANYLLNDPQAIFPTNFVIGIPQVVIEEKTFANNTFKIKLSPLVQEGINKVEVDIYLTIIDGQHRVAGIQQAIRTLEEEIAKFSIVEEPLKRKKQEQLEKLKKMNLIVSFFIDPTLEYQAMIFSTINRTQTKVSENLVYSLFGLSSKDSPQKSSLNITLILNSNPKSPFVDRIKLAGGIYKRGQSPPLSQATLVKSILKNICGSINNAEIERYKDRQYFLDTPNVSLPFRIYYGKGEDSKILRILVAFYNAVKETFKNKTEQEFWKMGIDIEQNILQTTVGFESLLLLLNKILPNLKEEHRDNKNRYISILEGAKELPFSDLEKYPLTSKTRTIFYDDLLNSISSKLEELNN
jgi:DGQHR domain-containing protein